MIWILAGLVAIGSGSAGDKKKPEEISVKRPPSSLWQVIDVLARQTPFTKDKVESALPLAFTVAVDDGNDAFQFWEGGRVQLGDGSSITKVDLRVKRAGGHPGFLGLDIGGTCVTLDQVREHFDKLEITAVPRGRSPDEQTYYTSSREWGNLSFGFAESNSNCLAKVIFDPKK
jgi:hypothetical protein